MSRKPDKTTATHPTAGHGTHGVDDDYARPGEHDRIGYRRPPAHSRFKPGQSGNKRGRPKGSKNIETVVRSLLDQKVTIQDAAGRRRVSAIEALLRTLMQRALRGDNRAAKLLLDVQQKLPPSDAPADATPSSAEDQEILADYLAREAGMKQDAGAG